MKTNIESIKEYFSDRKPLGSKNKIEKIIYLGGGNHFNYKISTNQGDFVLRISNSKGLGVGILYDIPDEFTLLKIIDNKNISPKVIMIELESPFGSFLIEEFIDGIPFTEIPIASEEKIDSIVSLIKQVSNIKLNQKQFPFRFTYNTYQTNIESWNYRLKEISDLGNTQKQVNAFLKQAKIITRQGKDILIKYDNLLKESQPTFIYNDIHPGNVFWQPKEKRSLFIDWQKVSLGDPAFMLAVFALAFEDKVKKPRDIFFDDLIKKYTRSNEIKDFKKLFHIRILEREISNMIWVVWASLKQNKKLSFSNIEEYERLTRTKNIVNNFESILADSEKLDKSI